MRKEFEQRPWQYFGTASVGVKQKEMMYYTEQDVKDARFADPDFDRDDDGDTRSREGIIPRVSPRSNYRQPNDIDFSSLGIRDDHSSKNKAWRTSSSDSQEQESSGIARLKAMTGPRTNNKPNPFVTPNSASDNPKLTLAMLRARADQTKNTEIDAPHAATTDDSDSRSTGRHSF